jgi:hypothetical protein
MAEVVMLSAKADYDNYTAEIAIFDSTHTPGPAFRHLAHPSPVGQDAWVDGCFAVLGSELLGACVRDKQEKKYTFRIAVIIRCV